MGRIQTTLTLKDEVSGRLAKIEKQIRAVNRAAGQMGGSGGNAMRNIKTQTDNATNATRKMTDQLHSQRGVTEKLYTMAKRYLGLYIAGQGTAALIKTTDALTSATARLQAAGVAAEDLNSTMNDIYMAARNSRASYTETAASVAKLQTLAGDSFRDIGETTKFVETMNKLYAVSGASAAEASSSMYQLTQAMASGRLQGDELRSILEGAPMLAVKLAESLGVSKGELKDLASEGKITANVVKNALLGAANEIDKQFRDMPKTFAQQWQIFKTDAAKAIEPVAQKLNALLNSEGVQNAIGWVTEVFVTFTTVLGWVIDGIQVVANLLNKCRVVARLLATVITGALISAIVLMGITAIKWVMGWVYATWQLIKAKLIALSTTQLVVVAILAAIIVIATVLGALGISIIGIVYGVGEFIRQTVEFLGTLVYNLVTGIIKIVSLAATVISNVLLFLANVASAVANVIIAGAKFIYNAFSMAANGTQMVWLSALSFIMSKVLDLINLINKIPGIDIPTGFVENTISTAQSAANKAKSDYESAKGAIDDVSFKDAWAEGMSTFKYNSLADAWSVGGNFADMGSIFSADKIRGAYDKGKAVQDNFGSRLKDIQKQYTDTGDYQYTPDESTAGAIDDIAGSSKDTAGNTAAIIEQIDALKQLAERDVINRFTTATISVDMLNQNSINSDMDIDGFIGKLSSKLYDEMEMLADGVHR